MRSAGKWKVESLNQHQSIALNPSRSCPVWSAIVIIDHANTSGVGNIRTMHHDTAYAILVMFLEHPQLSRPEEENALDSRLELSDDSIQVVET
jgi:hypothetical protein